MKQYLLCLLFVLGIVLAHGQPSGQISGELLAEKNGTYSLLLKRAQDSMLVKAELSNPDLKFVFEFIPQDLYFLEVRQLEQVLYRSDSFRLQQPQLVLSPISLNTPQHGLREIKIVQQKAILEQKADKLIYHVEHTLEAPSNDALQVMQKAPGITVDQNGTISMRGKRGVQVMINGKPTYLSGAQLANLLRTTQAAQIARIEVISNPSSKYDAEGNAGIINIILKKDQKRGSNGMIVLSYGHGKYHKSANGINYNLREKKLNLFSSLNVSDNVGFNDLQLYRQFYTAGNYQGAYRQYNYLLFPSRSGIAKIGLDYYPNSRHTLGWSAQGSTTRFNPKADNIAYVENPFGLDTSYYTSTSRSRERYSNLSVNLYSKHVLDSSGSEISTDWDYANYGNTALQHFTTRYFTMQDIEYRPLQLLHAETDGRLYIFSGKADLTKTLSKNWGKLEAGIKSSYVKSDQDIAYYDHANGVVHFDSSQSNHFVYSENINALYLSHSFDIRKLGVQWGWRAEQTVAKGKQLLNGQSFQRNYWQLFPTLFLSRTINASHQVGLSFSRRIQRPGYDLMNPVRLFIDATTYKTGNPYLIPQNSYIAELNHTWKQTWLTSVSATWINQSITEVLIPDETQTNITIQTNKNLNRQFILAISESANVKPLRWWTMQFEVNPYYSFYSGILANMPIRSGMWSFNAKSMHMIQLPRAFTLQADAFFQYRERYSFSSIEPFGALNLSLQKTFKNKRTSLRLSANDVFYSSRFRGSSRYTNYYEQFYVQRDSRTLVLAITHRYGKSTVPGAKKRASGAEDEKQRAGKNV